MEALVVWLWHPVEVPRMVYWTVMTAWLLSSIDRIRRMD